MIAPNRAGGLTAVRVTCFFLLLWNLSEISPFTFIELKKINLLLTDVRKFLNHLENQFNFQKDYPFNELYLWLEKETCDECIEYVVSIMMEPFGEIIQPLIQKMSSDEEKYFNIPTERTVEDLNLIWEKKYPDILTIDFNKY